MVEVFATCVSGLEDIAAAEAREVTGYEARVDVGKVLMDIPLNKIALLNYCSRSLHRIYILAAYGEVSSLDDVEKISRGVDYVAYVDAKQSFAVRAERHGEHSFTSPEVAARVGHVIIDEFRKATGKRLRVNLDEPDVEFFALVRNSEFFLGINTTGESLHRRYYRVWHHRAALLPTIAYAMLRIAEWGDTEHLLDPFCGGATIPIEAALMALGTPLGLKRDNLAMNKLKMLKDYLEEAKLEAMSLEKPEVAERLRITASDASPKALEGASRNIEAASLTNIIKTIQADVRYLDKHIRETPDKIVTNPPYGVRMGLSNPEKFYEEALKTLAKTAPEATLTLITTKQKTVKKALENTNWQVKSSRTVKYGTLTAQILNITR